MASAYSCGTCRVKFSALDVMQSHYKCDWHRYNLKRKVAELPPISAEDFAAIVRTYQKEKPTDASGNPVESESTDNLYCGVCAKSFQSAGSLASHLESKKHVDRERGKSVSESSDGALEENQDAKTRSPKKTSPSVPSRPAVGERAENGPENEDDWEDEDDDEELPPYDVTLCLYCPKKFLSLEQNLDHMSTVHSFFIPDVNYCADVTGLIDYLGKKTTDGHMCLYCNAHFQDAVSVQRHMDSKGHRKMGYEGDYLLEYEDFYDFSAVNTAEGENSKDTDGDEQILDGSGYEMTLPSGATIGHRDLNRYYRQSLRPVRDVVLRNNVAKHYKALGWTSSDRADYASSMTKEISRLRLEQQKKRLDIGMKFNKIRMRWFRRQLM